MGRLARWGTATAIALSFVAATGFAQQAKPPVKKPPATQTKPTQKAPAAPQARPADAAKVAEPQAKSPVQALLDSKAMLGVYNGVVIDYLLAEGKTKLTDAQRKQALEQLVAALKDKTQVSKEAQRTAAIGNLVGVLMGVAGNDVVGDAGAEVQRSYAGDWASWVDAAEKLFDAGYKDDAVAFFQFGMANIPYSSLRARCIVGLAKSRPEEAYSILAEALKKPEEEVKNESLRMMGHLAAAEWVPAEQKDAIMKTLVDYSQGMMHSLYYQAAIYGLDASKDLRAIPALSRFRKGFTTALPDRQAALKSLLLTYKDETVVADLAKMLKTGFTSTNKPEDRFFAGVVLMQAGRKEGFDWALNELKPKKGGFFASKENVDLRPDLVMELVRVGGEQAAKVLADSITPYKNDEWLKTWMAIGLLELGNTSQVALAKAALGKPAWEFTAVRVSTALASNGDYTGIPVLAALAERTTVPATPEYILNVLGGKADPKADKERLRNLRRQVATALGEIDHADAVPVLVKMLGDADPWVRSNAAFALAWMKKTPAALGGVKTALTADYGVYNNVSRNSGVWAFVLRSALLNFPQEPAIKEVLKTASTCTCPAVRLMALTALQ